MNQQTEAPEQEENDNMEGGLPDIEAPGKEEPKQDDAPAQNDDEPKPVYTSPAGEFKNVEDLIAHTKELEKKMIADSMKPNQSGQTKELLNENHAIEQRITEEPALEDLILTDTKKAVQIMKSELRKEMARENEIADSRRDFYDTLYTENPILQPYKEVVQLIVQRDHSELSGLTLPKAKDEIKKRALKFIGSIAERTGGKLTETQVKGGSSQLLTSSASQSKTAPKQKIEKPINFADQVKQMRQKKSG